MTGTVRYPHRLGLLSLLVVLLLAVSLTGIATWQHPAFAQADPPPPNSNAALPDQTDISNQPPAGDPNDQPPANDNVNQPPPGDNGNQPPAADPNTQPPVNNNENQPPAGNTGNQPPAGDSDIQPPVEQPTATLAPTAIPAGLNNPNQPDNQTAPGTGETGSQEPEVEPTTRPYNSDSLSAVNVSGDLVLAPGQSASFDYSYFVSTSRFATTISAGLTGDADGWSISVIAGNGGSGAGFQVSATDSSATSAGSAFGVSVVVTAPSAASRAQSVSFWISGSMTPNDGYPEETGASASGPSMSVQPPSPATSIPTETPTPEPTATTAPTETPTPEPTATSEIPVLEPTATTDATASPTATTEPTGTVIPTETPTPEPTATATLEPTATPSPTPIIEPLDCQAPASPVVPGGDLTITCTVPDAIWASQGSNLAFAVSSDGEWLNRPEAAIDTAGFSFDTAVPCTAPLDQPITLDVTITGGVLPLTATVPFSIGKSTAEVSPELSVSSVTFGKSTWTGSSWTTTTGTAQLQVTMPDGTCSTGAWQITASAAPLTSDDSAAAGLGAAMTVEGGSTTADAISLAGGSFAIAGSPQIVASGTGSGTITLNLTLTPPADTPPGYYTGSIDFSIVAVT